jgi:hypothetical protein
MERAGIEPASSSLQSCSGTSDRFGRVLSVSRNPCIHADPTARASTSRERDGRVIRPRDRTMCPIARVRLTMRLCGPLFASCQHAAFSTEVDPGALRSPSSPSRRTSASGQSSRSSLPTRGLAGSRNSGRSTRPGFRRARARSRAPDPGSTSGQRDRSKPRTRCGNGDTPLRRDESTPCSGGTSAAPWPRASL